MKRDRSTSISCILHFVTWFPSAEEDVHGIFTRRHIELLATDTSVKHIVIQKLPEPVSVVAHLKALAGWFPQKKIGSLQVIYLPDESALYKKWFWRLKTFFEHLLLKKIIRKYKPSLLHLHVVYGFGREAVWLKKKYNIPFIVSEHMGPFPFSWIQDVEANVIEPIRNAHCVIAVSHAQASQISKLAGLEVAVIPNVVNDNDFYYSEYDLSGTIQIVLTGLYDPIKGADYLLAAFPLFLKQHPAAILHLVGGATDKRLQHLQQLAAEGGISSSVVFHGSVTAKELNTLFAQCSFYVCASEWESFGLTMLEALFTGLPVLSTDCGGVHEFMNSENGIIIANDRSVETLLQGMLQMTGRLSSFNRKAIATDVQQRFSASSIKEKYYSVYQSVTAAYSAAV